MYPERLTNIHFLIKDLSSCNRIENSSETVEYQIEFMESINSLSN
jgi:hypothetical protein